MSDAVITYSISGRLRNGRATALGGNVVGRDDDDEADLFAEIVVRFDDSPAATAGCLARRPPKRLYTRWEPSENWQ